MIDGNSSPILNLRTHLSAYNWTKTPSSFIYHTPITLLVTPPLLCKNRLNENLQEGMSHSLMP